MGNVRLDGVEISQWPKEEVGPFLGYLPQDVELLDGTITENISRFGASDDLKVVNAAKLAGAHELILALPQGYDTCIGQAAHILSAGQRQLIGLARAIYGDPRLIILDEPNANLDIEGETALKHALQTLKELGHTLIIISHKPSILESADTILVLQEGAVEMFGPRDQIMEKLSAPIVKLAVADPQDHQKVTSRSPFKRNRKSGRDAAG